VIWNQNQNIFMPLFQPFLNHLHYPANKIPNQLNIRNPVKIIKFHNFEINRRKRAQILPSEEDFTVFREFLWVLKSFDIVCEGYYIYVIWA